MRIIYFDCFSGISGDMALGALLDLGLDLNALRGELGKLGLSEWSIASRREQRAFLTGTRALVHAPEQATHRHLADVAAIINASALSDTVKAQSLKAFTLLAVAEGQVHGVPPESVHFHEVGALDAIVDIVGVVAGLQLLGVEQVFASALPLGTGWVRAAHGLLPVPAPATLNLLAGVNAPIRPDETPVELVTPTGAALLAALATFRRPAHHIERVGYGLGKRELAHPNALRAWLGTLAETQRHPNQQLEQTPASAPSTDPVLLETNIDDQAGEQLAYVCEQLLALGALDVWQQPILMKKGRAAVTLAALVPAPLEADAVAMMLRETSTLGIRRRAVSRHVAERRTETVPTPWGPARRKWKILAGTALSAAPEYDDCAQIARTNQIPLRQVYRIVEQADGEERV